MRLAARLSMSYLVMVALAAAMSLGLTLVNASTVREILGQQAVLLAQGMAGRIDRMVGLRIEEMEAHTRHVLFQEALARSSGSDAAALDEALSRALQEEFITLYERNSWTPPFLLLEAVDERGAVVARASTQSIGFPADPDWWSAVRGGGFWAKETPGAGDPSAWGIGVAVGVDDSAGQLAGAFRGVLSGTALLQDAVGDSAARPGREVRVIDGGHRLVYSTGSLTFGEDLSRTPVVRDLSSDSGSFSGSEGGLALYYSYARSISAETSPALGWIVLVVDGRAEVLAPISILWRRFSVLLLVLAATMTVVGIILARSLSRPMALLTESALAVDPQEPRVKIPPPLLAARDETGSLARAIGEMARSLEQSVAESRRNHRLVVSLNQVAHAVLLAGNPEEVFAAAGRGMIGLGFHTAIWRVEEGGHSLSLAYTSFPAELLCPLEEAVGASPRRCRFTFPPGGACASIISATEPGVFPMEPVWQEILAGLGPERIERAKAVLGPRQSVGMPLRADGGVTYLLMVICPQLLESDAAAIGAFGSQVAVALTNAAHVSELEAGRVTLETRVQERTAEVAQERNLLRTLIDSVPDLVFIKDRQSRFVANNKAHLELLGAHSQEQALGKTDFDFFPRDMAERFYADDQEVMRTGVPLLDREETILRADGQLTWGAPVKVPILDQAGAVVGLAGISRDITAHKAAEEEVQSLARFPAENPNPVLRVSRESLILYANGASAGLLKAWATRIGSAVPQELRQLVSRAWDSGGQLELELQVEKRTYSFVAAPISGEGYANLYGRDITERKALGEQLLQAQKMEAIGRLAGGIAHDFNNLMTVVVGYGDHLARKLAQDAGMRREAEEIGRAAGRAAALTHQLLAFSRQQVLQRKAVKVAGLMRGMEQMLSRLIGEDVQVEVTADPATWRVFADPGQLEQVLLNLAINARDAMPEGGRLLIESANVELDEAYAARHVSVEPGRYVSISVTDTGCGMDEQTRARLFEPFFTTKPAGKGTGLGLSTAYGIVRQSGGNIWVYSEPGRGSTFRVYLPAYFGSEAPEAPERDLAEDRGGTETILLVEDEESLRSLISMALEEKGYSVVRAKDGEEALKTYKEHVGPFHLLITDVVLPKASGVALSRSITSLRPEMPVLFMSGYTDRAVLDGEELGAHGHYLQKPFGMESLGHKVRAMLDAARGAP